MNKASSRPSALNVFDNTAGDVPAKSKPPAKRPPPQPAETEEQECVRLNELAIRCPWVAFDQRELSVMMRRGKAIISAAFKDDSVETRFSKSRPEEVAAWIARQENKIKQQAVE